MKKIFAGVAGIVGVLVCSNWDVAKDFILESPSMSNGWDNFTTPEPKFPAVETNPLNRSAYANVVRNPLGFEAVRPDRTTVIYESRVPSFMDDPRMDAVGRLIMLDTTKTNIEGSCTAQISEIDGYSTNQDILFSAGHCFDDYPIEQMLFITDYIDANGEIQTYKSELTRVSFLDNDNADIAVASLLEPIPNNMHVFTAIPDHNFDINDLVTSPGFSSDKDGLHVDSDCVVIDIVRYLIINTCDIVSGASGSALIVDEDANNTYIAGVLEGTFFEGHYKNLTVHTMISSSFLDQVPFLERTNETSLRVTASQEYSCLLITAQSGLNIRSSPSSDFDNVVGAVENLAVVYELARVGDWSKIAMEDDVDGYIHRGYTRQVPC